MELTLSWSEITWVLYPYSAFAIMALFGAYAGWHMTARRREKTEKEQRLETIHKLVCWWQTQDQDYRGKNASPHELVEGLRKVAVGEELDPSTEPSLFHDCGCLVLDDDHTREPHLWIPPSIREEYGGAPPLNYKIKKE